MLFWKRNKNATATGEQRVLLDEAKWPDDIKREIEIIIAAYRKGGIEWDPTGKLFTPRPEPIEGTPLMLVPYPRKITLDEMHEALEKAGVASWRFLRWDFQEKVPPFKQFREPSYATQSVWTPASRKPLATLVGWSSERLYKENVLHLGYVHRFLLELIWEYLYPRKASYENPLDSGIYTLTSSRIRAGALYVDCRIGGVNVDYCEIDTPKTNLCARQAVLAS